VKLCLIGDGPEAKAAHREAVKLGVADHLEMAGWQSRDCVRAWLARSSVFVLPTSKEALSIASLEALSVGLPVVALDQGGVGDIVEHGREGLLVHDDDALGDAVECLLRDPGRRARMAEAGRAHVHRFAWPHIVSLHERAYGDAAHAAQISTSAFSLRQDDRITELSASPLGRGQCNGPTLC
jgi:glycosyltransferase involved in cell wall biosynthesis